MRAEGEVGAGVDGDAEGAVVARSAGSKDRQAGAVEEFDEGAGCGLAVGGDRDGEGAGDGGERAGAEVGVGGDVGDVEVAVAEAGREFRGEEKLRAVRGEREGGFFARAVDGQ